jgi:hypothetical protein
MSEVNVNELSAAELEQLLKKKKAEEAQKRQEQKAAYEAERDEKIMELMREAVKYSAMLRGFKELLHELFEQQQTRLNEYGEIRSNSKGGFSITHSSGDYRVKRIRATEPSWDERSLKAVELISEFLQSTVKKKDLKTYEILMTFMSRNKNQDLEYNKVMELLQHEDKYDDPRWKEGLQLLRESYSLNQRGFRYDFFVKDQEGSWERIELNFSSL